MGHKAKWEYFRAVYVRYRQAGREAKQVMLNEYAASGATHVPGDPTYHNVYVSDVLAHAEDSIRGLRYPATGEVKADVNGELVFPGVLFDTSLDIRCSIEAVPPISVQAKK